MRTNERRAEAKEKKREVFEKLERGYSKTGVERRTKQR